MSDLIYREQALKAVSWDSEAYYAINNVPSAEKTGKWLDTTKEIGWPRWTCSACGGDGRGDYMFCPWCGVRMVNDNE